MTDFTEAPIRKFYLPTDYICQNEECEEGFKKVVIVLRRGRSWLKQGNWTPLPGNPYPVEDKTIFGVVCKNDHFVYDPEANIHTTKSNRNGNRGRQYILARAACFTYWHDDYFEEFFLCFTDEIMRRMVRDGYYDPRDDEVIELQKNKCAEDEIIALPEINGAKKAESDDVASKVSSKWKEDTILSSISKVVERRKQNPWKRMLEKDLNQNFVAGVTGNIITESPEHELSLLSDFPAGDSTASSVESQIESPERSSTPAPELIDESTQTPPSSSLEEEKDKDDFFSKASNWLKSNTEVHVALTVFLAAVVLTRRQTIIAIFR